MNKVHLVLSIILLTCISITTVICIINFVDPILFGHEYNCHVFVDVTIFVLMWNWSMSQFL